jgi:hypothetical protein
MSSEFRTKTVSNNGGLYFDFILDLDMSALIYKPTFLLGGCTGCKCMNTRLSKLHIHMFSGSLHTD